MIVFSVAIIKNLKSKDKKKKKDIHENLLDKKIIDKFEQQLSKNMSEKYPLYDLDSFELREKLERDWPIKT